MGGVGSGLIEDAVTGAAADHANGMYPGAGDLGQGLDAAPVRECEAVDDHAHDVGRGCRHWLIGAGTPGLHGRRVRGAMEADIVGIDHRLADRT